MRITVLSLIYPPETGSARRVGELVEQLAGIGNEVTVVTGFPSYPKGVLYPGYRRRLFQRQQMSDGVEVIRLWLYISAKRNWGPGRLMHYISFCLTALITVFLIKKTDVIYIVSHPYFLGLSAKVVKMFCGGSIVLDVQDSWPEAPIALGYVPWRWAVKMLELSERLVYSIADLIITLSPEMADHLVERGAQKDKVASVYNWVNMSLFSTFNNLPPQKVMSFEGKFVILFAGNIGQPQGLDVVLDAAKQFNSRSHVLFVILGEGADKARLTERTERECIDNVKFLPGVSESEVLPFFAMADALLVHLRIAPHRIGTVPSKLQIYMATGKPILLGATGAAKRLVQIAGCGVCFEPENSKSLYEAVESMIEKTEDERKRMGNLGKRFATENFDVQQQSSKIMCLLTTYCQADSQECNKKHS